MKTYVSKYFTREEVACRCKCGFDTLDAETAKVADDVREFEGEGITPNSCCRCIKYNRKVQFKHTTKRPVTNTSQHLYGRAMDLPVKDPKATYDYLCKKYPGKYGFGLYTKAGFVHVDTKTGGARRWGK